MISDSRRRSGAVNWKILIGLLGAVAALITAVATVVSVRGSSPPSAPPPNPAAAPTARDAEQLATRWIAALQSGDVETLMSMSSPPFYMDSDIQTSKDGIRARYQSMLSRGPISYVVTRMDTRTVAEFKAAGLLDSRDRILSSMRVEDGDFAVAVYVGKEGALFFYRRVANGLEMAGFWD